MFYTNVINKRAAFQGEADPFALEFSTDEALINGDSNLIGIANEWSVVQWTKPANSISARLVHINLAGDDSNEIDILHEGSGLFRANIQDVDADPLKSYRWGTETPVLPADVWTHWVLTWDGSDLLLYVNGVETAPDALLADQDDFMEDTARQVVIAANSFPGGGDFFNGRLHSTAVFNVALDQDSVTEIYDGKGAFDLRANNGDYNQSSNLQHYWRHGFNASDIGEDLGNASVLIDVGNDALNIDASDIVEDAPV